ncbi:MAG: substrate-binding domain-containing protein [Helicobacteraceae bacterium]|nr:substrate-binding domain-containing protein [Helicobacteraceae bacterium]
MRLRQPDRRARKKRALGVTRVIAAQKRFGNILLLVCAKERVLQTDQNDQNEDKEQAALGGSATQKAGEFSDTRTLFDAPRRASDLGWLPPIWRFFKLNPYMWSLIYAPSVAALICCALIGYEAPAERLGLTILSVETILIVSLGYFRSNKLPFKDSYFKTYFALFLPIVIAEINLSCWYALELFGSDYYALEAAWSFLLATNIVFVAVFVAGAIAGFMDYFFREIYLCEFVLAVYCLFAIGFAFGLYRKRSPISNKKPIYISMIAIAILAVAISSIAIYKNSIMIPEELQELEPIVSEWNLRGESEAARKIMDDVTIRFDDDPPILDGATAFYPIYIAFANKFGSGANLNNHVFMSRTPRAYIDLIEGNRDLIFVFEPSDSQLRLASDYGAKLALTPIGKEAFVFLTNEKNPVRSLTIEQIQKIYAGEITNWSEVGGENARILAFQRDEGSGSQTAMENNVMKGLKLKTPLQERIITGMSELINSVADYRNAENAIGYSFRNYVTDMQKAQGVRLLEVNGVAPTKDNIVNGSYPFTQRFYIIGRENNISQSSQKLIDWFLSDQGQALIEAVGYVSLNAK